METNEKVTLEQEDTRQVIGGAEDDVPAEQEENENTVPEPAEKFKPGYYTCPKCGMTFKVGTVHACRTP